MRCIATALWLLLTVLGSGEAQAGGLSVLPTRLDFGPGRSVQSVLLTNVSDQTVTVETELLVWSEGNPAQLANDIVITPAVVTMPPNQRVRVRVGLLRPNGDAIERAYRLYFTELPAPVPLPGVGLGVRLRIGIPVFVPPAQPQPGVLTWTFKRDTDPPQLEARNDGNVHLRLASPRLVAAGVLQPLTQPIPYVLARSSLSLALPAPLQAGSRVRWLDGDDERESAVAQP